jgi:hypothetical protein
MMTSAFPKRAIIRFAGPTLAKRATAASWCAQAGRLAYVVPKGPTGSINSFHPCTEGDSQREVDQVVNESHWLRASKNWQMSACK